MIPVIKMLTVDEGFRDTAYKDTMGKTTVGIGFNMDDPYARGTWVHADISESFSLVYNKTQLLSKESAWKLLNISVEYAIADLKKVFVDYDTYPEGVRLALLNLIYNMGEHTLLQFKTFISLVIRGDYINASKDLGLTKWATEVPNRALRVCDLLLEKDDLYNV